MEDLTTQQIQSRFGHIRAVVTRHQLLAFGFVTLAITWGLWVPLGTGVIDGSPLLVNTLFTVGAFGPAVSAIVVTWLSGGHVREFLRSALTWRLAPKWYLLAVVLPIIYFALPNALAYVSLGTTFHTDLLPTRVVRFVAVTIVVMVVGGGQEELGWRGFLLPRLQSAYGPIPATLVVGIAWACWHLPLYLTSWRASNLPFPAYAVMVVGMAFVFTWLYNATGSVLLVMVLHGAQNSANGLLPIPPNETVSAPLPPSMIVAQVLGVWVFIGVFVWIVGPSLGLDDDHTDGPPAEPSPSETHA